MPTYSNLDVLFGRGCNLRNHAGNLKFRQLISDRMEEYERSNNPEKTDIAETIVTQIYQDGGRFLKQADHNKTLWEEVDDELARLKVTHTFRSLRKIIRRQSLLDETTIANAGDVIDAAIDTVVRESAAVAATAGVHDDDDDTSTTTPVAASLNMKEITAPVSQGNGSWNEEEKNLFFDGLRMYGKGDWKSICEHVRSRDRIQTRNFGVNYFKRLAKTQLISKRPSTTAAGVAAAASEGTAKVDFERQVHHFPAANVPQKRAAASKKKARPKKRAAKAAPKAVPKKRAAKKRAAKATAKAEPKAGENTQAEPSVASPPQVFDILNIGTDHFSIIRLSLFNEMTAKELQKLCLKTVGLCDYYAKNDGKMYFALKQEGAFLQRIENNKIVFKSLIDECCKPLSELVFILEPHLLNLFPLLLLGELHMHSDRKIQYPVGGVIERWCLNITDKNMQLQQQGNPDNHVIFPCNHGNFVCMSDIARGIVEIADGVRLQHGCPTAVMEAVGSRASITIVMDLCFGSKAVKDTVMGLLFSRFPSPSAVPSESNSYSIQSLREVATTAVATRSPILLQDIDPNGIVKDAIDEKKALLLSTCARYQCNEKTDEGTRYCTTCVQGNKECCVEGCMDNRHSHERDCLYCLYHSDRKTRCAKCLIRGLADGSRTLCSTCNGAWSCGHCNKSFTSTHALRYHVDNNVCMPATEGTCLVERERIIIPNKENVIIIFKLVLSFL